MIGLFQTIMFYVRGTSKLQLKISESQKNHKKYCDQEIKKNKP